MVGTSALSTLAEGALIYHLDLSMDGFCRNCKNGRIDHHRSAEAFIFPMKQRKGFFVCGHTLKKSRSVVSFVKCYSKGAYSSRMHYIRKRSAFLLRRAALDNRLVAENLR